MRMPFFFDAAILSRMRSPVTSRSNWANDSSTLRVRRPMLVVVLKDWVTDTNETSWASNSSTSFSKIRQCTGEPVHLVDDHDVDPSLADIAQELLQSRTLQRAAG